MAWHDERLCVLDLETSGIDVEEARIVTAAIGYAGGGQPTDLCTLISAVDVEIPAEATAIHGWTTERARREGRPPEQVLDILLGYLDRRPQGSAVVAYNTPYDLTVLDRETRRYGADGLEHHRPLQVVDPLVIDRHLDRYRPGSRKLAAVCAHHRVRLDAAHTAASDALSAGRLAWRLAKTGRVIRRAQTADEWHELLTLQEEWFTVRDDLPALHEAQARWHRASAEQLQAYFRAGNERKGIPAQPDRVVAGEWPVVPMGASA